MIPPKDTLFKSGFIAITGQPNTGKSTFLNRVLGRKAAIVTPKAQTTRTRIMGVCNRPHCQMVFLDTPGIHNPGSSILNKAMVRTALNACQGVDLVLYLLDATRGITLEDRHILKTLPGGEAPLFLVMNKVDQVSENRLLARLQEVDSFGCSAVVPISALTGDNVERLLSLITDQLSTGPHYFPEDQWTDQPEHFFAAEIIREKLFMHLQKELPYALAVQLEKFQPKFKDKEQGLWNMEATILVQRDSQKAIVIGHKGCMLKKIGSLSRVELERIFGVRIFLKLWVKVRKNWTENRGVLNDLGYPDGEEQDASV